MKRIVRLFSKRSQRCFAVQNKEVRGIINFLENYAKDKKTVSNHLYYSVEKLYRYEELIKQKIQYLSNMPVKFGQTSKSLNVDIINQYFIIRKEIGFNESLLASLLNTLVSNSHRTHDYRALKEDLAGEYLVNSPLFKLVIDDVKLMTYEKMEVDLEQLTSIMNSLTKLNYKDISLSERILGKLLFTIRNPTYDSNDLKDTHKEQLLTPSLQNYKNILSKDVFKNFLNDIINIQQKPIDALKVNNELRRLEYESNKETDLEDVNELDKVLERLESVLENLKNLNIEFLNTIYAIRSYYFELRSEQKTEIMKQYPEIYLDFVRLENNLIKCGFLMPLDLIENQNPEDRDTIMLLMEQFILDLGSSPKLVTSLIGLNDQDNQAANSRNQNSSSEVLRFDGQVVGGIDLEAKIQKVVAENKLSESEAFFYSRILEVLQAVLDNMNARTSCINPKDNYKFEGFKQAFSDSGVAVNEVLVKKFGKIIKNPFESFDLIDHEKTKMGHFYFTKLFQLCHSKVEETFETLNTAIRPTTANSEMESLDLEGLLRLYVVSQKSINPHIADLVQQQALQALQSSNPISLEAIHFVVHNVEYLSTSILSEIVKTAGLENFGNERFIAKFVNDSLPLSEQINAVFFLYVVTRLNKCPKTVTDSIKQHIFKFASQNNLEQIYEFQYQKSIPLTYEYHKLFYVCQYIKEHENEYLKFADVNQIMSFEKVRAKINTLLNIDFEFVLGGDPVYAMIFNKLVEFNPEVSKNLESMHSMVDVPIAILPNVISQSTSQTNCLLLNLPSEDEKSVSSAVRKEFLNSRINHANFQVVSLSRFFNDPEFYQSMNFQFADNLDSVLKRIWHLESQNKSSELNILDEIAKVVNVRLYDNVKTKHRKYQFIKIFSTLEESVIAAQNSDSPKFNLIRKAIIFYSTSLLRLLNTEINEEQKNTIKSHLQAIKSSIPEHELSNNTEFPFSFHGKRFSLDTPVNSSSQNKDHRDFLNYKLFNEQSYFVVKRWKTDLEEFMDPVQFNQTSSHFFTKYGKFNKVILPNVNGRQMSRPSFQYFWEELAYASNTDQKQKILTYETISSLNNFAKIDSTSKWKVALLNFAYEFRTKPNLEAILEGLFDCDFWHKLVASFVQSKQKISEDKPENNVSHSNAPSVFEVVDVDYYLNPVAKVNYNLTPYEEFMKSKLEIKKSLDYWKQMFDVTLPKLYNLADSDVAKNDLHAAYVNAKEKYHEALKLYQTNVAEIDSAFNFGYFKDLIVTIHGNSNETITSDPDAEAHRTFYLIKNQDQMEKICQNNAIKFMISFKERCGKQLTDDERSFKELWSQFMRDNGIFNPVVVDYFSKMSMEEALSEKDKKFFEQNFFHSSIHTFTSQKINDLLVMLNILLNPELVAVEDSKKFINAHLPEIADAGVQFDPSQLVDFMAAPIANSSRFDLNYNLNSIWQKSCRISDNEREIIKEMLSLHKSKITRALESRCEMACQRYAGLRSSNR